MKIILASHSPARKRLLEKMGLNFTVIETNTNERGTRAKTPSSLVKKITLAKAKEAIRMVLTHPQKEPVIVITADSIVYKPKLKNNGKFLRHFPNGPIIGKAKSRSEVVRMLSSLSNTTHYLYTGLCVAKILPSDKSLNNYTLTYEKASVRFRKLTKEEIRSYSSQEESRNYAGAYTIERHSNSSSFIKSYHGDLDSIIGLPTHQLKTILKDQKILN